VVPIFWTSYALGLLYPGAEDTTNLRNGSSYLPVAPKVALLLLLLRADVSSHPHPTSPLLGFFLSPKRVTEEDKGASESHHVGIFEGLACTRARPTNISLQLSMTTGTKNRKTERLRQQIN
jgi:hypothetical protein